MSTLWTEKYRPKIVDDLDVPEHIRRFLTDAAKNGHPHLLLYGPPGTGKTTFANLLSPTFQLNASDDRGIATVRGTIKQLANTVAKQVIVLDECENLTKDAQTCLRRVLEDYPNTTFIFCTNYHSSIIGPLKSRLLKFKFRGCNRGALERVGAAEGLGFSKEFYDRLFQKCGGDLRRCINVLQGIKPLVLAGHGSSLDELVDEAVGIVPEPLVAAFWSTTAAGRAAYVNDFVLAGYSALQLVKQLNEELRGAELQQCKFSLVLAQLEESCINGCSDELVLGNLCMAKLEIYG